MVELLYHMLPCHYLSKPWSHLIYLIKTSVIWPARYVRFYRLFNPATLSHRNYTRGEAQNMIFGCGLTLVGFVHNLHYNDVIMNTMASQITSLTMVYSTVYSRRRSKKNQSSASLAFVRIIHRWSVNSPHKGPVTRKMSPFDDVIMPEINDYDNIFPMSVNQSRMQWET